MAWYKDKLVKLVNKDSGETIFTRKNKKQVQRKLEMKKFSKKLQKRVVFKEAKK
jgi:ribosomal protein L33